MIRDLKFNHLQDNGDATANYSVEFKKGLTIRELVDMVLKQAPDEWGYIELTTLPSGTRPRFSDVFKVLEYRCGQIVSVNDTVFNTVADIEIEHIDASGGWTRMDYTVNIPAVGKDMAQLQKESKQRAEFVENYIAPLLKAAVENIIDVVYRKLQTQPNEEFVLTRYSDGGVLSTTIAGDPLGVIAYKVIYNSVRRGGGALSDTLPTARTDNRT